MDSGQIEVRIRHSDFARSSPLCSWPISDLGTLIRVIDHWGWSSDGDDGGDTVGQFSLYEGEAFFEIVVGIHDG